MWYRTSLATPRVLSFTNFDTIINTVPGLESTKHLRQHAVDSLHAYPSGRSSGHWVQKYVLKRERKKKDQEVAVVLLLAITWCVREGKVRVEWFSVAGGNNIRI